MKIIITEKQSDKLANMLREEVYQMPQNIGDHENKPYTINPEKVKIVRNFLDKTFKKGNYDYIGSNGMPERMRIVAMISPNGDVLRNMKQEDLLDLLIDKFQNMFLDHTERELFMKQVLKDWFDDKINVFGNLSVNRLLAENVENEEGGVLGSEMDAIVDYIIEKIKEYVSDEKYIFTFLVPGDFIKEHYPYKNPPEKIVVISSKMRNEDDSFAAFYDQDGETISLNPKFVKANAESNHMSGFKEILSHEITHLVNDREGGIQPIYLTNDMVDGVREMLYLFRPTEMTARINGLAAVFKTFPILPLTTQNIPVTYLKKLERITALDEMENFLKRCDEDAKFRKCLLNISRKNSLGKMTSIAQYKQLFERYKKKVYRVFYDWQEYMREEYMKQVLQQSSLAVNEITSKEVTDEANEADTNPTELQKEAGNYKMGHISVKGMKIAIENPKGSKRYYYEDGKRKYNVMKNHYGYFNVTKGKDGDAVDVFIGPNIEDFENVYCIDQKKKGTKKEFDETKVMLGFKSIKEAKAAYLSNYSPGWDGIMSVTEVPLKTFKKWLYRGRKQRQPFADYVYIQKKKLNENRKKNLTD